MTLSIAALVASLMLGCCSGSVIGKPVESQRMYFNKPYDQTANVQFRDDYHPLETHQGRTPESYLMDHSVTNIGTQGERANCTSFCLLIDFYRALALAHTPKG